METVATEIEIDRPIDAVFAQLTDVENNSRWMKSVSATELRQPGELSVGAQFVESGGFLGVTVKDEKTVTHFKPPSEFRFAGQFIDNAAHYELSEVGAERTQVTATLTAEPPRGLPALVRKQIMRRTKARMQDDLQRLKQLLEQEVT